MAVLGCGHAQRDDRTGGGFVRVEVDLGRDVGTPDGRRATDGPGVTEVAVVNPFEEVVDLSGAVRPLAWSLGQETA